MTDGAVRTPDQVPLPARVSGLPRPPAEVFVGRDDDLSALRKALERPGVSVVIQAAQGSAGVGASELALQYAADHPFVWWVSAADDEVLQESLAHLARTLEPAHDRAGTTTADAVEWALRWLQCHPGWLLVLDDVEDRATVAPLLDRVDPHGNLLITTRRDIDWGTSADVLPLTVLASDAAVELLTALAGSAGERELLADLAAELVCRPLALVLAGAYLAEQGISVGRYLAAFRASDADHGPAPHTIARVCGITWQAICEQGTAAQLLAILAYLSPDGVPRRYLKPLVDDESELDRPLGVLASYRMITLDGDTVLLHGSAQAVVREQAMHTYRRTDHAETPAAKAALALLLVRMTEEMQTTGAWPQRRRLSAHVDALARAVTDEQATEDVAQLLADSAHFASNQGRDSAALPRYQRALRISKVALGPDHLTVADRLGHLAIALSDQGRDAEAVPLWQQALPICEAAVGPDHPQVANALTNLAGTLSDLGRDDEALPLLERAVRIGETTVDADPGVRTERLGQLAATLFRLDRSAEALPLLRQALAIKEAAWGPDHPGVAVSLDDVAGVLSGLDRHGEALALQQRAVRISEAALGPDHPDFANHLDNLASSLYLLDRADQAMPIRERALRITEAALGPWHATLAVRLNNTGHTLNGLGRAPEAIALHQRALLILKANHGSSHPAVAQQLDNLATTLCLLGEIDAARTARQRALTINEATLGPDHPTTQGVRQALAHLKPESRFRIRWLR